MSAALAVEGVCVAQGARDVLRGVDLTVTPGEVCVLMGTSGAGKSTVLRAVAALQPFRSGTVRVSGVTLRAGPLASGRHLRPLRQLVGMVFQSHALFEHLRVLDNVTLAPVHAFGWTRARAEAAARTLLASLGVEERADAFPRELSGGEAQRVAIARALAPDPRILLMDEPTSALDPARRGALAETLRGLARDGRALLIATHDVEFAGSVADSIAVLSDGVVVERGSAAGVLRAPRHEDTRRLLHATDGAR